MEIETKGRFAEAALRTFDLTCLEKVDIEAAIESMMSDLDELLGLNDPLVMKQRHEFLKVPGSRPEDFGEKVHQISAGFREKMFWPA